MRAVAVALAFSWLALPLQAEHLPFKYLSSLDARWGAAEIVCTATVSAVIPTGALPIIEGATVREYLVSADVDRVFKGNWAEQKITFRWLGMYVPDGIVSYIGPPTGDFQSNTRYLLFLGNEAAPEVVTPVFQTAIRLTLSGTASEYMHVIAPGASTDNSALAAEMVAAIYAEPSTQRDSAEYFGHIGELLGGTVAAHTFETFYIDGDPTLRVVAAKMASQWSHHDPVIDKHALRVLLGVAADSSAPEFSRSEASLYLAEMHVQKARPYAEAIVLEARDSSAREFALRALVRLGTRSSEAALEHALNDPVLTNQFLAAYALQRIECRTSLDENMFRRDSQEVIATWESHASDPATKPPCKTFGR